MRNVFICLNKSKIVIIILIIMAIFIGLIIPVTMANSNKNKYSILVDVEESKMYIMENGVCTKTYSCSGGKASTPSPIGTWTIISKAKWGEGFGGSWLGFNVPWGQFGIHGTTEKYSVGWASSHGCIRMNNSEVAELYKYIPIGTKVTIVDGVYKEFGKGYRDLKSGMYGSDIRRIQEKLKELGFFEGVPNGKFGNQTEQAIQKYCKKNGLYIRKTIGVDLQKRLFGELMD